MSPRTTLALAAALAALPALAQERPAEGDLFGGNESEAKPAPAPAEAQEPAAAPAPAAGTEQDRDTQALNGPAATNAFETEDAVEDPLKIGGRFYLRAFSQGNEGVSIGNTSFSAP
ncbi:MAG: hypothetical protein ACXU88_16975, partial [Myxococcaceae bacterium]